MNNTKSRDAAKIFNSSILSALSEGDCTYLNRVAERYSLDEPSRNMGFFFDTVFERLGKEYRSEYFFKNYLVLRHLIGKHSLNTATMLSEFRVGKSKADCVILNGKSTCYEIKTEHDTLTRLKEQLSDYSRLFDEVVVICNPKHYESVLALAPGHVGISILTPQTYFHVKREPVQLARSIDRDILMKSLRKEEYKELASSLSDCDVNSIPNSELFRACNEVIKSVDEELLRSSYIKTLKKYRAVNRDLFDVLPRSLKNAAISYQFSASQVRSLQNIFSD